MKPRDYAGAYSVNHLALEALLLTLTTLNTTLHRRMSTTSRFLTLAVWMLSLVLIAACEQSSTSDSSSNAEANARVGLDESIPFRKDGTLQFSRSGESYLSIDIEIADSDSAIVRGLMQRTSLPERGGMLFLMPAEEPQQFWMSNTQISLDILFANSAGEIVSMTKYTTPLSQENVVSTYPAKYVIEVAGGFVDSHGILEGDTFEWSREEAGE